MIFNFNFTDEDNCIIVEMSKYSLYYASVLEKLCLALALSTLIQPSLPLRFLVIFFSLKSPALKVKGQK